MTQNSNKPEPDPEGRLIDWALGQLDESETSAVSDAMRADAVLAAQADGWRRLIDAERTAWSQELAQELNAAKTEGARIAAQVRFRAGKTTEEVRPARRRRTARVLAISIGLHAAALALLALFVAHERTPDDDKHGDMAARFVESDDSGAPDEISAMADLFQDAARTAPIEVPDSILLGGLDADLGDDDGWGGSLDSWVGRLQDSIDHRSAQHGPLEHPRDVAIPMWIRRNETLKSRRLTLLGFEADGTLRAVRRGLRWLGLRQRADGSFEAPANGSTLRQTALAMLPFLGDGHDASRSVEGPNGRETAVVRRGITWIRSHAFTPEGFPKAELSSDTLGVVAMVLSEDYMLGYVRLRLAQAHARATEITRLAEALRAAADEPVVASTTDVPWSLWGLDATTRTGLVPARPEDEMRFQAWVAAAQVASNSDPLTTGTAVLLGDRSPDKAGFRVWGEGQSQSLLATLLPNGRSRSDSDDVTAVGETARRLLALQIAYRTY